MNQELSYKLLRYLVQGVVIYLFLRFVPKNPMSDMEILLTSAIIILAYAILENLYNMYLKPVDNMLTPAQCESTCTVKETLVSIPQNNTDNNHNVVNNILPVVPNNPKSESEQKNKQPNQEAIIVQGITRNNDGSYTIMPVNNKMAQSIGSRQQDGVMSPANELAYNYVDYNTLPVSPTDPFSPGDSYLPPSQWYPVPPHPPVCVTEKVCPVCPIYTNGTDVDLKQWDSSRRISPPDNINTQFIEAKLNSGR